MVRLSIIVAELQSGNVAEWQSEFATSFAPLLPLRWLHKDAQTVALAHPRPFWPHHYLVVPRRAVPHLLALVSG
jgi:diadenosine tetraphosphate (Ap4A) HIT family hydrolase